MPRDHHISYMNCTCMNVCIEDNHRWHLPNFQDVEPEPQPLLAGLRQQGDQAAGAPAGVLAESEVRAGLGLGPGPPAAAPGPSALALRAQLPGHGEGPAAVEPVAGQE